MSSDNAEMAERNGNSGGRLKKTPARPRRNAGDETGSSEAPNKKKRVTLADIARRAGVSPTSVSITLANRRDISISETTRARIKRCAESLGYIPNRLGDGFLHGRSKLIGVLILAESYRPFLDCIAGIHEGLALLDCFPLLMSRDWVGGRIQTAAAGNRGGWDDLPGLRRLLEYQVDGIIYFSLDEAHALACHKELSARKIPMVVLGGVPPAGSSVDTVGCDNEKVGWMAAEHLLSVGCTSFAFGKATPFHAFDDVVHSSFAGRLRAAGHECRDFMLDMENSGDLGGVLSGLVRPPAGIFCARDDVAALALRAVVSLGWRVPRECAVVAMGEAALSRLNLLPVTTINRNSFVGGETAAKLLVQRIEGFAGKPQSILIPPSFEVRASSMSDVSWLLQAEPSPSNASLPRSRKRP